MHSPSRIVFAKADAGRRNDLPDCLRTGRTFRCATDAPDGWPTVWGRVLPAPERAAMGLDVPIELNGAAGDYVLAFGSRVLAVVDRSRRAAVMVPEPQTIRAGCAWREFRWALGHVRFEVTVA